MNLEDRPITTSIGISSSNFSKLEEIVKKEGYKSRNQLINCIISNWLKNYEISRQES